VVDLAVQNLVFITNKKSKFLESYGELVSKEIVEHQNLDFNNAQVLLTNIIMCSTNKSKITNYLNKSFIEKLIEYINVAVLNFIYSENLNLNLEILFYFLNIEQ
jgi:hypothetical protein